MTPHDEMGPQRAGEGPQEAMREHAEVAEQVRRLAAVLRIARTLQTPITPEMIEEMIPALDGIANMVERLGRGMPAPEEPPVRVIGEGYVTGEWAINERRRWTVDTHPDFPEQHPERVRIVSAGEAAGA